MARFNVQYTDKHWEMQSCEVEVATPPLGREKLALVIAARLNIEPIKIWSVYEVQEADNG